MYCWVVFACVIAPNMLVTTIVTKTLIVGPIVFVIIMHVVELVVVIEPTTLVAWM